MNIGFTGTQQGMTDSQKNTVKELIVKIQETTDKVTLHHGDCVGSDADAHAIASSLGCSIIIHPPLNPVKRAFCIKESVVIDKRSSALREENGEINIVLPPKDYLDRNHDIVDSTEAIIVCPFDSVEQLRSGTWATWRYAKKKGKPIFLVLP